MSTAEAAEAPAAEPVKKGGKMKLIAAVLVLLLAAGGGAAYVFVIKKPAPAAGAEDEAAEEGHEAPASGDGHGDAKGAAASDFYPLAPQFVVNLNDEEAMRFLQVEVQVIARKNAAMDAVRANDPIVRNRLMMLFSTQTYQALLSREGKEKLQLAALAEINRVLDEQKKPHIDGVVFTNLVMQ